ncbi:MAG: energy transducer TonB [Terracidiphilus sp.]|jgi:TonB family protein
MSLPRPVAAVCCAVLALAFSSPAQQPTQPDTVQQPTATASLSGDTPQAQQAPPQETPPQETGGITEAELKQLLVGKELYLRGGYLDNTLSFSEHGSLIGHSPQGSYTLNAIQIDKVRISKHKVTLEGARYGLHFLGQLASEDTSSAYDRVRITPNKKVVKITIDREMVVKPKKEKGSNSGKEPTTGNEKSWKFWHVKPGAATAAEQAQPAPPQAAAPKASPEPEEMSEADQLKASIAATPEEERPADPKSVTTTISPAHATRVLKDALDNVFAQGLDERMMASLPDFWKLYYQAVAAKADYRPKDPSIFRQSRVDQKARLLIQFEPDSNEFAQSKGVAGMAQYHAVVGPDGKVSEVVISRPIGFGLDESAVAAIRKAQFQPAIKDGKPVAVILDLNVPFRIFSKMTNVHTPPEPADKPAEPVLPGPYSVPRP